MDGPLPGEENMRIDRESLDSQNDPSAVPVFRFFRWLRPTVSYGRLQEPGTLPFGSVEKVRRPTGGGAVLHGDDLSFSLAWRRDHPFFPRCLNDIYRAVHETVRTALAEQGIDADFFSPASARPQRPGLCFTEPARDDLMWKGRKIVGGALRVTARGRLYQGNLLTGLLGGKAARPEESIARALERRFFGQAPFRETGSGR